MSRVDLPPSTWLDEGLQRRGMTQAEAVRAMRARGIQVSQSELSRWKSSRYARSKKVPKVYRFLFEGTEKDPAQEGGADEVLAAISALREDLAAARETAQGQRAAALGDREAMTDMLAEISAQLVDLREYVETAVVRFAPTTDDPS